MSDAVDYEPSEHYDRVTAAWGLLLGDELHYGLFENGEESLPQATGALTARMVAAAGFADGGPGRRVLDVGCGSGAPACELAERFGAEVVGITTSGVGVETAHRRAAERGLDSVSFEQRDGTDNGFDDASFDVVWVMESSHLMRDRAALLSESARVLRPGGRLVLCDLVRHREIPFSEVRDRRQDFATLRTAFGDAHFETLERYAELAGAAGLQVHTLDDLTLGTLGTFERWRENAARHREEVVELIGVDGHDAFVRSCDLLEAFWRDGTFGYGLLRADRPT